MEDESLVGLPTRDGPDPALVTVIPVNAMTNDRNGDLLDRGVELKAPEQGFGALLHHGGQPIIPGVKVFFRAVREPAPASQHRHRPVNLHHTHVTNVNQLVAIALDLFQRPSLSVVDNWLTRRTTVIILTLSGGSLFRHFNYY